MLARLRILSCVMNKSWIVLRMERMRPNSQCEYIFSVLMCEHAVYMCSQSHAPACMHMCLQKAHTQHTERHTHTHTFTLILYHTDISCRQGIVHGIDRYRPDIYDYDDEEEKWFNDEEESIAPLEDNVHSLSSSLISTTPPASLPGAPSLVPSFFNPSEPTEAAFLHPTSHSATFPSFVGSPRPPIKIRPITIAQTLSTSPVSSV